MLMLARELVRGGRCSNVLVVAGENRLSGQAATAAGFTKSLQGVRIEGTDKPGVTAKVSRMLADAGISFRALSASAHGRKFVSHIAVDSPADAAKAAAVLRKLD
jgi:predicted amino acid-binding ACT domain protein